MRGAIAQTAERTLHSLADADADADADQAQARSIFLRLTDISQGSEPTRRRVERAELAAHQRTEQSVEHVFSILADARLVTIDERSVTVSHKALIRHWHGYDLD